MQNSAWKETFSQGFASLPETLIQAYDCAMWNITKQHGWWKSSSWHWHGADSNLVLQFFFSAVVQTSAQAVFPVCRPSLDPQFNQRKANTYPVWLQRFQSAARFVPWCHGGWRDEHAGELNPAERKENDILTNYTGSSLSRIRLQ